MTFKEILAELFTAHEERREPNVPQEAQNAGFWKAYRAWANSTEDNPTHKWQNSERDTIICGGLLDYDTPTKPEEAQDFLDAATANGITTIILTDKSTALMDSIHALTNAGARITGTTTATQTLNFYSKTAETAKAIKLTIPTETETEEKTDGKTRRNIIRL